MLTNISYADIIKFNKDNSKLLINKKPIFRIKIITNITCLQLIEFLKYYFLKQNINIDVDLSTYDNFIEETHDTNQYEIIIVFWELCNFINGANYKTEIFNNKEIKEFIDNGLKKINLFLELMPKSSFILFNKFSANAFVKNNYIMSNLEIISNEFNKAIYSKQNNNFEIVDINLIYNELGVENAVNYRDFYLNKSLYTNLFYKRYTEIVSNRISSKIGLYKKVLVLDCDNTLWGGILSEDGIENIKIDENSYPGCIYFEIQTAIKKLYEQGVYICICSKNDCSKLKEVFSKKTLLKFEMFSAIESNWEDKPKNILKISKKLNLGLKSFVFLDDSDFEINFVKESFPEISVFKAPTENIFLYPKLFNKIENIFYQKELTTEDINKQKYHEQDLLRNQFKNKSLSIKEYINSLKINLVIRKNNEKKIDRIYQIMQKTNQFNTTLKRYNKEEIKEFFINKDTDVFDLEVSDKYGSSGLTALSIIKNDHNSKHSTILNFLLSCRILGRKIEYFFLNYLFNYLNNLGIKSCSVEYINSDKNHMVKNFLLDFGFTINNQKNDCFLFNSNLQDLKFNKYEDFKINIKIEK